MVCGKCNETCANPKETLKCVDCSNEFHIACSRIRVEKFKKMTSQDLAAWRCTSCRQDVASVSSLPDNEDTTLIEVLKSIKLDMAKNNQENRDNFTSLKKDISAVNTTLHSLESKFSSLKAENENIKAQCQELKTENEELTKQVHSLQSDMREMQQYTRSNNLEIRGVPVTTNENIYTILGTIANALNIEYSGGDISIAHRLQQPKDKSQPPSIVAQFVSRYVRNDWLVAARKKHLQTTDLIQTFRPAPVYINEHLTAANKALLGKSKFLVKKGKLHAAWTRNGVIYVRKTSESRTQRVQGLAEVCDIAGVAITWDGDSVSAVK